jgi:hypothetical protein
MTATLVLHFGILVLPQTVCHEMRADAEQSREGSGGETEEDRKENAK